MCADSVIYGTIVPYLRSIPYSLPMDFVHPVEALIPGAQGRILAVLVETSAELNLRTLARLAGVSVAQASRVVPHLVDLGVVERREVPPSSLFCLNSAHVVAQPLISLARSREAALVQLGAAAATMGVQPESVIIFGSFARGEADTASDIDVVMVRPDSVEEGDPVWVAALEAWRSRARSIAGNRVELIDVGRTEVGEKLTGRSPLWRDIAQHGVVVHGASLRQLNEVMHA